MDGAAPAAMEASMNRDTLNTSSFLTANRSDSLPNTGNATARAIK
jgi:hypothetical protein